MSLLQLSGPVARFCDEGDIWRMPIASAIGVEGEGGEGDRDAARRGASQTHLRQLNYFFGFSNKHKYPLLFAEIPLPPSVTVLV